MGEAEPEAGTPEPGEQSAAAGEPRFILIEVDRNAGVAGEACTLKWATVGATSVEIEDYGVYGPFGELEVAFEETRRLVLTASGPGGTVDGYTEVLHVFPRPRLTSVVTPPFEARHLLGSQWAGAAPAPEALLAERRPGVRGSVGEPAWPRWENRLRASALLDRIIPPPRREVSVPPPPRRLGDMRRWKGPWVTVHRWFTKERPS